MGTFYGNALGNSLRFSGSSRKSATQHRFTRLIPSETSLYGSSKASKTNQASSETDKLLGGSVPIVPVRSEKGAKRCPRLPLACFVSSAINLSAFKHKNGLNARALFIQKISSRISITTPALDTGSIDALSRCGVAP